MYVINPESKTPIFQINTHIGEDNDILGENGDLIQKGDGQGIDGRLFSNEVLSFNDSKNIDELLFYINSQGGDVQQSLDITNSIAMSKQKTHSIITGFAFSCLGWAPLVADKVDMVQETGRWMCHMPYDPENPEEKSQFMDEVVDIISGLISSKSGRNGKQKKSKEDIQKLMSDKTYWNAKRMYDEGLIDRVVDTSGKVVRTLSDTIHNDVSKQVYKNYQSAQNKLIEDTKNNNQIQIQNTMQYKSIIIRLNAVNKEKTGLSFSLTEDASAEDVTSGIAKMENRIRALNDDMMDMTKNSGENKKALDEAKKMADDKAKDAETAMCSYNSMKEKYENMEMENKAMKSDKEKADNKAKEADLNMRTERAKNLIEKAKADGKIQATDTMSIEEAANYLTEKAISDYNEIDMKLSFVPKKVSAIVVGQAKNVDNDLNITASGKSIDEASKKLRASNIEKFKTRRNVRVPA